MKRNYEKRFFVYILKCSDGTFYTGWTTDVHRRCLVYNQGKGAKYTRSRLPVEVQYWVECDTKSEAMKREIVIKNLCKTQKKELIRFHQKLIKEMSI
jgi:putative endonuclease